jgi:enoyl-CoA hydratase
MPEDLISVKNGRVAQLCLSNPPLNLIGLDLLARLRVALSEIEGSRARVLVLTSTVPGVFSAGADVRQLADLGARAAEERLLLEKLVWRQLADLPIPTIAAIDGVALGGGLELALCCDLRMVSQGARLGLPETRLGIIPSGGGTQRLTRLVGAARAKELILLAEPIAADDALRIGLANRVVPKGLAHAEAIAAARIIAERAPAAVRQAKRLIDSVADLQVDAGLAMELQAAERLFASDDSHEGFAAFLAKRAPRFRDR